MACEFCGKDFCRITTRCMVEWTRVQEKAALADKLEVLLEDKERYIRSCDQRLARSIEFAKQRVMLADKYQLLAAELAEMLRRGQTLLKATVDFIGGNPVEEYIVYYDEDGACLSEDCRIELERIGAALAKYEKAKEG